MKQKDVHVIESYDQLKALSDPLRIKILIYLIEKARTGQQIAQLLDISRPKVHYHLKELEKHGLIQLVRKEEKNGILQKYYKAIAKWFMPSDQLLPHLKDETVKYSVLNILDRAKKLLISTPNEYFRFTSSKTDENHLLMAHKELKISKDDFIEFSKRYWDLVKEYEMKDKDSDTSFYLATACFQTDQPIYDNNDEE